MLTVVIVSACNGTATDQSQLSNSQAAPTDCRLVQHSLGEVCVPLNPQRVVALGEGLDIVLSLGVKPVGSVEVGRGDYYMKSKAEGVESVGDYASPNLETIAALKPDLILGTEFIQGNYELLSQIAPTVIANLETAYDWKKLLNKYAEALGKPDKAEQILADYDARIEDFQRQMGDRLQQTEVSVVRVNQGRILIYLEGSYCGSVVADAGLPRPSHQNNFDETFNVVISKELLHKVDGDVIFAWSGGWNEDIMAQENELKQLKADPLWSELNAVQQNKVYDVPGYWLGMGPMSANLILDDLFKYLVDSPPQAAQ